MKIISLLLTSSFGIIKTKALNVYQLLIKNVWQDLK